jgi:transposase
MSGFDTPLAAWRVYATVARVADERQDPNTGGSFRDCSRRVIQRLADSLNDAPPLRRSFLDTAAAAAGSFAPHAGHRRSELQALNDHLTKQIDELDQQVSEQARERPQARRLMTHPGVGPVTALAFCPITRRAVKAAIVVMI